MPKAQDDYENCIYQHILPALGDVPLDRLTAGDLQQFYARLKQSGRLRAADRYGPGLSDRMIRACHTRRRTALDRAVKDGLILANPAAHCKRLQTILEHANCKKVRFHDLRHVFSTMALEHGMDVKTLSAVIGHVSANTALNIYTHVTDAMRQAAADKIDRGIAKCKPAAMAGAAGEGVPAPGAGTRQRPAFEPYKGKIRKAGTGCVTQLNDHLGEGKFSPKWPDGKKHSRSVYAKTERECEEKLAELIQQMRSEITQAKQLVAEGRPCEAAMLANTKSARGRSLLPRPSAHAITSSADAPAGNQSASFHTSLARRNTAHALGQPT